MNNEISNSDEKAVINQEIDWALDEWMRMNAEPLKQKEQEKRIANLFKLLDNVSND